MKVLIVEDEKVAANRLEKMLHEIDPEIQVLAKTGTITESAKWLVNHEADLIFLDIQLSDGISFSIFDQVTVNTPVIFTTAYDQYAIKAFQLNSIAYLLKPIRKTELEDSLKKYKQLKSAFSIDFEFLMEGIQNKKTDYKKRFLIQIGDKIKKIETHEIAWFYALEKNVFLTTFSNQSIAIDYSLDALENLLDPEQFFRINRKYFLNMNAIESMTAYSRGRVKIKLNPPAENEMDTIVSVERAAGFKKWLNR
ncbi:MAG: LytTR family DNA-binding domain-containing protein [Bacteroidales bacterium]|jgi:DNA-binding LytR/AlgR family response regulator|nr:LytTR family DNA-binding domain-containing protein [Bacteroidales bacterium]